MNKKLLAKELVKIAKILQADTKTADLSRISDETLNLLKNEILKNKDKTIPQIFNLLLYDKSLDDAIMNSGITAPELMEFIKTTIKNNPSYKPGKNEYKELEKKAKDLIEKTTFSSGDFSTNMGSIYHLLRDETDLIVTKKGVNDQGRLTISTFDVNQFNDYTENLDRLLREAKVMKDWLEVNYPKFKKDLRVLTTEFNKLPQD